MKARVVALACCFFLLCSAAPGLDKNRLDIALEGPWILYTYQDSSLANGNTVLVAMAPGGVVNDDAGAGPKYFHSISIRTGDGYYLVVPGIYCLTFDSQCGRPGVTQLTTDGYPAIATPVFVHVPNPWPWMEFYRGNTYATALILPMPDSYSTDGAWPMRFGSKFDIDGKGYKDWGTPKHSIAIQLHYSTGPVKFDLLNCNTLSNCTKTVGSVKGSHTMLENTGTLRISMKSPDNEDVCDPHVRHAYPFMMALLGADTNKDIKVIDPARGVDANGNAVYKDDTSNNCLQNDDQKPKPTGAGAVGANSGGGTKHKKLKSLEPPQFSAEIGSIIGSLDQIATNPSVADSYKAQLLLPNISEDLKQASTDLSDQFPRISQIARIDELLKLSQVRIVALQTQLNAELKAKSKGSTLGTDTNSNTTLSSMLSLTQKKIKNFLDSSLTKGGNDCRAPLMLVQ